MKYYEVHLEQTCKAIGSKTGFYIWNNERKQFNTLKEVKAFLQDTFGNCKRSKMYIDDNEGNAKHAGYVYHYNTPKASYDDSAKNNQDWVTVNEIKSTLIIVK